MDTLRKDVSFALRGLARSPGFVAVIVATLGLGIGANVAIFTVVDGMLLEALPYERGQRGVVRICGRQALAGLGRRRRSARSISSDWVRSATVPSPTWRSSRTAATT